MTKARPQEGVSYAGGPVEFAAHSRREATRSLADWLGTTETRAGQLLEDGEATAEIRSRNAAAADDDDRRLAEHGDPRAALRVMRRAYGRPWLPRT